MNQGLKRFRNIQKQWIVAVSLGLLLGCLGLSQSGITLSGKLDPWPQSGWPKDKAGEVQVQIGGQMVAKSAIASDGKFTLTLPASIAPTKWEGINESLKILQVCDAPLEVTPADTKVLLAELPVFTAGETKPFGFLVMQELELKADLSKSVSSSTTMLYSDRDAKVTGLTKCGGSSKRGSANFNFDLKKGWNYLIASTEMREDTSLEVKTDLKAKGTFRLWPYTR